MNKYLIALIIFLSLFSFTGNAQYSPGGVKTLEQRVDSLERQMSYLKLSYELDLLNLELEAFKTSTSLEATDVKLDIAIKNFDRKLFRVKSMSYDSSIRKKESFSNLIEMKKNYFIAMVIVNAYTESELNVLYGKYDIIDGHFEALETSLNYLKAALDIYEEML